nr:immunoglobulin light chain junction region [Macaca mulatta]
CMQGKQFPLTF